MEISNATPSIDLTSNLSQGDALSNGALSGAADQGAAAGTLGAETAELSSAAETAFASVFFSLLQNILSEAQNNSGS